MPKSPLPPLLRLIVKPMKKAVAAYIEPDGSIPVLTFLDELNAAARANYLNHFELFAQMGYLRGDHWKVFDPAKSKGEVDGLSAFKHIGSKSRILAYTHESICVLLGGVSKAEDHYKSGEINRLRDKRDEFRSWVRNKTRTLY